MVENNGARLVWLVSIILPIRVNESLIFVTISIFSTDPKPKHFELPLKRLQTACKFIMQSQLKTVDVIQSQNMIFWIVTILGVLAKQL